MVDTQVIFALPITTRPAGTGRRASVSHPRGGISLWYGKNSVVGDSDGGLYSIDIDELKASEW